MKTKKTTSKILSVIKGASLLLITVALLTQPAFAGKNKKKKKKKKSKSKYSAIQPDSTGDGYCGQKKNGSWEAIKVTEKTKKNGTKKYKYKRDKSADRKNVCTQLSEVKKVKGLQQLPSLDSILDNSTSTAAYQLNALAEAPSLKQLASACKSGSVTDYFFESSQLTKPENQCTEDSYASLHAGLSAWWTISAVANTMSHLTESLTSICYLGKVPSASGGVKLKSNKSDVKNGKDIFSTPASKPRRVNIEISGFDDHHDEEGDHGGEHGDEHDGEHGDEHGEEHDQPNQEFAKVAAKKDKDQSSSVQEVIRTQIMDTNANFENSKLYDVRMLFCEKDENGVEQATRYENISVIIQNDGDKTTHKLLIESADKAFGDEHFYSSVSAGVNVAEDGSMSFSDDTQRNLQVAMAGENFSFSALVNYLAGKLTVMTTDEFKHQDFSFKGNRGLVANISGKGSGVKVDKGASQDQFFINGNLEDQIRSGSTWNGSKYASSVSSELNSDVKGLSFDHEIYKKSAKEVVKWEPPFDCGDKADVTVAVDMAHKALAAIEEECESDFETVEQLNQCEDTFRNLEHEVRDACDNLHNDDEDFFEEEDKHDDDDNKQGDNKDQDLDDGDKQGAL